MHTHWSSYATATARVYLLAVAIVGEEMAAQEVTQGVFIKL